MTELSSKAFFGDDVAEFKIYSTQYDGIRYLQYIESQLDNPTAFKGAILGDAPGLGKTRTVIGLCEISRVPLTLIICTKSTLFAWYREALNTAKNCYVYTIKDKKYAAVNFTRSNPNLIDITVKSKDFIPGVGGSAIVIINHDTLSIGNSSLINSSQWDRIVIDEAHALRNGSGTNIFDISQNIRQPMNGDNRIGSRIAITGTPVENDISDIISLFRWIDNRSFVAERNSSSEVSGMIRKYLFRRNKDQITGELKKIMRYPTEKPIIHRLQINFPETDLSSYLQTLDFHEMKKFITNSSIINRITSDEKAFYVVLSTVLKYERSIDKGKSVHLTEKSNLRYSLSCPYDIEVPLLLGTNTYNGSSVRVDTVLSIIREQNDSFVIFHRFEKIGKKLAEEIKRYFPTYSISEINGTTDDKMRDNILQTNAALIAAGGRSILISSIQATSEGLNYQFYSKAIFVDPDWNPKVELQALHRLYRIGQDKQVMVWILNNESFFIKDGIVDIDARIETVKSEKDPLSTIIETNNAAWYFRRLYLPNSEGLLQAGSFFGSEFESLIHGIPGGPDSEGPTMLNTLGESGRR